MANGSFFGDFKSRLGIGARNEEVYEEDFEEYEDDYEDVQPTEGRDPYMDRSTVTTRTGRYSDASGLPRLVSMDDARASAKNIPYNRDSSYGRTSSIRSYGRTMVDSSLPPTMTAEGTAAVSGAANRRAGGGLDSLFGGSNSANASGTSSAGASDKMKSKLNSSSSGSSSFSSSLSSGIGAKNQSADILRDSMQLSMPGQRKLQVIKPTKYDDAEAVTSVLKTGDAAILSFGTLDRALMKRILDFSFGAASALDATVECIGNGVFAICRNVPLDDRERTDLHNIGIA